MYARGILFGKMKYELGDHSVVRCTELGLVADIEFKTKGWVGGTYNAIAGVIRNENTGQTLYELSGLWSEEMFIKNVKVHTFHCVLTAELVQMTDLAGLQTGHKEMFFNALRSKPTPPQVRPIEEQEERESQRLWARTAQAVKDRDHVLATEEKTKVEDMQREEAAKRAADGVEWRPRLFRRVRGGPGGPDEGEEDLEWIINAQMYGETLIEDSQVLLTDSHRDGPTPEKQTEQILAIYPILKGQKPNTRNVIPARSSISGSIGSISHPHHAEHSVQRHSTEQHPNDHHAHGPSKAGGGDDLIDFGQNDSQPPAPKQPEPKLKPEERPAIDVHHKSTAEIQSLLSQTGSRAPGGPLIDFHEDLKTTLPAGLKRADTAESSDEFVDAHE